MKSLVFLSLILSGSLFAQDPQSERSQLYLMTLEKMRAVENPNRQINGDVSRIDVNLNTSDLGYRGKLKPFWRTRIIPDRWLAANGSWLLDCNEPIFHLLEKETGRLFNNSPKSMILSDAVSMVRLLGGWKSSWKSGEVEGDTLIQNYDLVYRDGNGDLTYRWELLHKRLDPIIGNGFKPFIVLDNVPYCFTESTGDSGYGQNFAPSDYTEWGRFVEELCRELVRSYGFEKANSWRFRIGTEMDNPNHWENGAADSLEKYLKTYDFATAAVRKVLPGAKVGPCNFNSMFAGSLNRAVPPMKVFEHFADGKNYATGNPGSPVDFVAISSYGMYWMGGQFDHPDAARHGYSPDVLRLHMDLLKRLRSCSPRFAGIPLEIQEHGTLFNQDEIISPEPGSFGAAWTAAQYAVGLNQGVSQIFHWHNSERIGGEIILFGHTWLRAMMDKMCGGEVWVPVVENASEDSVINAFAVRKMDRLYLIISCYNADCIEEPCEKLKIILPEMTRMQILQYQLSVETAPYDVMHSDLTDAGHVVGSVNTLRAMSDAEGPAMVTENSEKYAQLQTDSFIPRPFAGTLIQDDEQVILSISVQVPSVTVLELFPLR